MKSYFYKAVFTASILMLLISKVATAQVGMNLEAVMPWSSQIIFVDVFKRSLPWITFGMSPNGQWGTNVDIPLDENGYPLEIPYVSDTPNSNPQGVASYIFNEMDGHYPSGVYTLIFEGSGGLIIGNGDNEVFFSEGGSYPVTINAELGDLLLLIISSNVENPIHNIRLIMPGFEDVYETEPFYPPFIDRVNDFSVIRYSQTMATNGGDYPCDNGVDASDGACLKIWENRNLVNKQTQAAPQGVAFEYLIDIANLANINPWICIPHGADDNYVREFATLVASRLNSNLHVYVELSNELFNFTEPYPQNRWAIAAGMAYDESLGLQSDPVTSRLRFITRRSAEIFHIFALEFGLDADARVVNVLPGFIVEDGNNNTLLEGFNDLSLNPNQAMPDVLAIGAYFGYPVADGIHFNDETESITPAEIVRRAREEILQSIPDPIDPVELNDSIALMIERNRIVVQNHGIKLIAYEGGQHIVQNMGWANDPVLGQKTIEANRHPDMYWAYRELMDTWLNLGGELFVHYSLFRRPDIHWGSFGALEWTGQDQATSYKYQSIMDWMAIQP